MSLKSKKKANISDKTVKQDIENYYINNDISITNQQQQQQQSTAKSMRTISTSSSSSSKMVKLTSSSKQPQQQQGQQRNKLATQASVNQRVREFFELFRCRFTSTRRHSKQSNRSNDCNVNSINNTTRKRNSSTASNNQNTFTAHQQQDNTIDNENTKTCTLCYNDYDDEISSFYKLSCCTHKFCRVCLQTYLKYQISEARVSISCPQCQEKLHPSDVYTLCADYDERLIVKYEDFTLRRLLVTINDVRFCPAPDCNFAVIATGCANCPELKCQRDGCNTSFCYHCKQYWHPDATCDEAAATSAFNYLKSNNAASTATATSAAASSSITNLNRSNSHISLISNLPTSIGGGTGSIMNFLKDEMKRCPKCQAPIVKMDDGSCNHITCAVCGCEFCWLCMKEISDLHYLSPSGCTFWGKKPWSRKKKILWQLGTLIGAPVGIALLAGVAIPAILIGLPIWAGRKVYMKFKNSNKHKRNIIVVSTVFGSIIVAPIVAALTVGIGVPILLAYVYGVVPISLCRSSGGCGVTTNTNGVRFAFDDEDNFTFNPTNNNNNQQNSNQNVNTRTSILKSSTSSNNKKVNNTPLSSNNNNNVDLIDDIENIGQLLKQMNNNLNRPSVGDTSGIVTSAVDANQDDNVTITGSTNKIKFKLTDNKKSSNIQQQQSSDNQSVNLINPSITGGESIGAFTTSLSASSNIDRMGINENVYYADDDVVNIDVDVKDGNNNVNNHEVDRDSASNRALAGSSKISFNFKIEGKSNNDEITAQQVINETNDQNDKQQQQQQQHADLKSFDSYSITQSEKSANPSVMALAGSIKDGDYQLINDDLDSNSSKSKQKVNSNNKSPILSFITSSKNNENNSGNTKSSSKKKAVK